MPLGVQPQKSAADELYADYNTHELLDNSIDRTLKLENSEGKHLNS